MRERKPEGPARSAWWWRGVPQPVPALVAGFLLQQALQGWCPPVSVLRKLGLRTQREIDEERFALEALRGDFRDVPAATTPQGDAALDALAPLADQRPPRADAPRDEMGRFLLLRMPRCPRNDECPHFAALRARAA